MKKGISLITLTVTIIVILILSATAILTLTNNNSITLANETVFKNNMKLYETELKSWLIDQATYSVGIFDETKVNVTNTSNYNGYTLNDIIPSIIEEDKTKFNILRGSLIYVGDIENEIIWANDIEVNRTYAYYDKTKGVNKPILSGMSPVRWNVSTDGLVMEEDNTVTETSANWYDYVSRR